MKPPLIKTWLAGWLEGHIAMHPGVGWPESGSTADRRMWSDWLNRLIEAHVTEAEAQKASASMEQGLWCEEHPAALIERVELQRKQAQRRSEAKAAPLPSAAAPKHPHEQSDEERLATAEGLLDQLYQAGWELVWYPDEDRFHLHRAREEPDKCGEVWHLMQSYKHEVYILLGHPMPLMTDYLDEQGHWDWRKLAAEWKDRSKVT